MGNIRIILKDFYSKSEQEREDIINELADDLENEIDIDLSREYVIEALKAAIKQNEDIEFYEIADVLNKVRKKIEEKNGL